MEPVQGIKRIEKNFSEVLFLLDNIDDENFNGKISRINFLYEDISKQKEILKSNFGLEELKKYNKFLTDKAKVIKEKFDNIIAEKSEKSISLKKELFLINNKKKLINYK